jgi:hypothetical protein
MTSIARRLGVTSAVVAVGLASLFVGSGTSGAGVDTGGTRCVVLSGFTPFPVSSSTPTLLQAWRQRECYNPERVTPLAVSIERLNVDGTWTTVASGTGEANYVCHTSTTRVYRKSPDGLANGTPFNCG